LLGKLGLMPSNLALKRSVQNFIQSTQESRKKERRAEYSCITVTKNGNVTFDAGHAS